MNLLKKFKKTLAFGERSPYTKQCKQVKDIVECGIATYCAMRSALAVSIAPAAGGPVCKKGISE